MPIVSAFLKVPVCRLASYNVHYTDNVYNVSTIFSLLLTFLHSYIRQTMPK
nr:MAG TPA: hypothetical protein [Caudoviricetes sp.]